MCHSKTGSQSMCDSLKEKMQTIKINKVNQNAILDFNFEIKKICTKFSKQTQHLKKIYSGISLRRTHPKADTLYKADRDFGPIL